MPSDKAKLTPPLSEPHEHPEVRAQHQAQIQAAEEATDEERLPEQKHTNRGVPTRGKKNRSLTNVVEGYATRDTSETEAYEAEGARPESPPETTPPAEE
ncbi:MAG TPA: hypothetical protein VFB38_23930 [Chthonomonadaceae bacterium]|nr:hypothetical protein [Chthonomonadaceae bacterium]